MRFYNENSWKNKIDPAFDKPVKTYLKFLCEVDHLPNDGQVTFKDESIELIRNNNNLSADYESESEAEMLQFTQKIGIVTEQEGKVLFNISSAIDEFREISNGIKNAGSITRFFKRIYLHFVIREKITSQLHSLLKLAEKLSEEESKEYYANRINVFINDFRTKHFDQSQEDLVLILFSLFMRTFLKRIDEMNEECAEKEEIVHLKSIVISNVLGSINSTMSQLSHQKDMPELLESMKKGDDKSLFKAVTIDKSLLSSKAVSNRIGQAQATGDNDFLNKLSKATKKRPLERVGEHGRSYAVLSFFKYTELSKLNNQELYYFLKSCGLTPPDYPDAFNKFMQRHIKKN